MSSWEAYDDEAKRNTKLEIGYMINFKKMNVMLERIDQETKEWDDKYPKNGLLKIWVSVMVILLLLFSLSHQIICIVTVPFIFFYLYVLFQMGRTWKRFQYNQITFWMMTVGLIVVEMVIAGLIQNMIWK